MIYSISEQGWVAGETLHGDDHYLEIVYPTLFAKGKARLYRHAHPDSLSRDHLLRQIEYEKPEELEDIKWQFEQLNDPVETIFGEF
jgi:hypothetical protein